MVSTERISLEERELTEGWKGFVSAGDLVDEL